jgi:Transmembrane secretion effector
MCRRALPEWVRARGLAIFMTVYFGAHTAGSALWGQVAAVWGLPLAHFIAAAGALLAIPITWRWHLQTDSKIDLTPSLRSAAPVVSHEIENDRGPVLVTVEHRIDPAERLPFLAALDRLGRERRRDGEGARSSRQTPRPPPPTFADTATRRHFEIVVTSEQAPFQGLL